MSRTLLIVVLLAFPVGLFGCKAKPAPSSGFLDEHHKLTENPNLPFNRGYWNRQVSPGKKVSDSKTVGLLVW